VSTTTPRFPGVLRSSFTAEIFDVRFDVAGPGPTTPRACDHRRPPCRGRLANSLQCSLGKRGLVGARYDALYKSKKGVYPNTDAGKAKLVAETNALVDRVILRDRRSWLDLF